MQSKEIGDYHTHHTFEMKLRGQRATLLRGVKAPGPESNARGSMPLTFSGQAHRMQGGRPTFSALSQSKLASSQ